MSFPEPRTVIGIAALAAIAIYDAIKNGRKSKRLREYGFLALCVAVAIIYGAINDQITSRISWEYFYYGKELAPTLGAQTPPDPGALSLQALRIGAEATWWVGLILGALMLLANNPSRDRPQLPYPRLVRRLPVILAITILAALAFGLLGYLGQLNWISDEFQAMSQTNYYRPRRFMLVYGVHLGGYIGGVIAAIYAIRWIVRERRNARS